MKINKDLLPIKAHFFFFMAAMGPILPQLFVIGKEIGIEPEVLGYITSVLPIIYVIAKPMFGYLADFFSHKRKLIFLGLITVMTLAYFMLYFVQSTFVHAISKNNSKQNWSIILDYKSLDICTPELRMSDLPSTVTQQVVCVTETTNNIGLITAVDNATEKFDLRLTPNFDKDYYFCLLENSLEIANDISNKTHFNAICTPRQEYSVYKSFTFWLFIFALFIGTIGFNVTNSISDAICFDVLGKDKESKYGAQRVWGTIGFGLTAMLAGLVVNFCTVESMKSFTPALIIMCIFSGLDLFSVSKLNLPNLSTSESIAKDVWKLMKHPPVTIFAFFATMAGIIDSFIIYFMFWHVEAVAVETGYMDQIKLIEGLVVAAECLAGEVPCFLYSGKIIEKIGYKHCMSMCFFFYAVRLGLIAWIPNPWYLVCVELFFQGASYALCYTCIVSYASVVAPAGTSATVQGLLAGMDDGLGFSIGSLIGGLMMKKYGGRHSFQLFSIAALITCFTHIIIWRLYACINKKATQIKDDELPMQQVSLKVLPTEPEEEQMLSKS